MIVAQSNSAGTVLGSPQGRRTWCGGPVFTIFFELKKILKSFSVSKFFVFAKKRDNWEDLAGNVREVWGSTRGTPKPCRWFLEFVEWQALRCYRMVVLG